MIISFELYEQFLRKSKKSENDRFFFIFGLILAVSQIPIIQLCCQCTYRTLIWCRMVVKHFVRILSTVFEKWTVEKWGVFGHF